MLPKHATRKLIVLLAAINLCLVGAYGFSFWKLKDLNERIIALNQEVDAFAATDVALSSLQETLGIAQEEVKQIDSLYVPANGVVDFISTVEDLARRSGAAVEVKSVEAADVDKTTKNFQENVTLRVEARGTWADTYEFLSYVESLPYKITVGSVTIEKIDNPEASQSNTWKGNFTITALKLK